MSSIKFNHVFGLLLILSALSAFVIPPQYTTRALPQLQSLFAPVSVPARKAGAWVHGRLVREESRDQRGVEDVKAENRRLRDRVNFLEAQLEVEQKRNAQWARLGPLKDRCVPVDVVGSDSGPRDSLALEGSTLRNVRDNAIALYPGGIAGQIQGRAGLAGAQLRLITDKGFKVRGYFVRSNGGEAQRQRTRTMLLEGVGGALVVRPPINDADAAEAKLRPGDVALAEEPDWPTDLVGQQLGTVAKVEPSRGVLGFVEVRVEPQQNLEMLNEVMVLVK
jgi:hypothetical protein